MDIVHGITRHILTVLVLLCLHCNIVNANEVLLQCSTVHDVGRLDCHPEDNVSVEMCQSRGCCWSDKSWEKPGIPACYFPTNYPSYSVTKQRKTDRGMIASLSKPQISYGTQEFSDVAVEMIKETKSRLRIRFTSPSNPDRWEPPIPLGDPEPRVPPVTDYDYEVNNSPFGIRVSYQNSYE